MLYHTYAHSVTKTRIGGDLVKVFGEIPCFSVQVSRREVEDFNAHWPCSSLPDASITFCFDSNGLCDILPYRIASKVDGPEAVALSQDAEEYGREWLRTTE